MSDNIFAEIYNRILSLFGQNVKDESKNTAVNRLRLVLMQDRTNLTPEIMNRMRAELIAVLSKYVELDKEALDLNIGQEGEQMALMLSIPVIRAKDEAEIEEALKKEDEAKAAEEESEKEEDSDAEASEEETEETSDEETPEDSVETDESKEEAPDEVTDEETTPAPVEEWSAEPVEEMPTEAAKNAIPKIEKHKKEETSEE